MSSGLFLKSPPGHNQERMESYAGHSIDQSFLTLEWSDGGGV